MNIFLLMYFNNKWQVLNCKISEILFIPNFDTASFRKQISSVTHLESSFNLFILVGFLGFKFVTRNPENISVYIFFMGSKMLFFMNMGL